MKTKTLTFVALLALVGPSAVVPARGQTVAPRAEPSPAAAMAPKSEWKSDPREKDLLKAERQMAEAIKGRDRATLERLVAEDFAYTGPLSTGELTGKRPFVAQMLGAIRLEGFSIEKTLVRSAGTTAVVNFLSRQSGSIAGRPWNPEYLYTDVWVERGGAWQLLSRHVTRAVKGERHR